MAHTTIFSLTRRIMSCYQGVSTDMYILYGGYSFFVYNIYNAKHNLKILVDSFRTSFPILQFLWFQVGMDVTANLKSYRLYACFYPLDALEYIVQSPFLQNMSVHAKTKQRLRSPVWANS